MDLALPLDPTLLQRGEQAPELPRTRDPEEARQAAESFEAFFLSQVVEQMFAGIEPDSMFGGGSGEKVYRSLLYREYGAAMARSGGVGISDMVQKEILRLQEVQQS